MSHFIGHPAFFDEPIFLKPEQQLEPIQVTRDFFADYCLSELQQIQEGIKWQRLTTDQPSFSTSEDRANHLLYQEKLICLLVAALILSR